MQEYELYGFSLFETFLAREGTFWRLSDHWNRLASSAQRFGLAVPDEDRFLKEVSAFHDATRLEVIRYTLLQCGGRWSGGKIHTESRILKRPWKADDPIPLRLYQEQRPLPCRDEMRCHKSGSRMLYQSGFHEARARGFDDCLFVDNEGYLLEGSTLNLCVCIEGQWYTPPLARGILPGVSRGWLISQKLVFEKDIRQSEIDGCDGVIATNSLHGLLPISAVGPKMLNTAAALEFMQRVGKRQFTPAQSSATKETTEMN